MMCFQGMPFLSMTFLSMNRLDRNLYGIELTYYRSIIETQTILFAEIENIAWFFTSICPFSSQLPKILKRKENPH